MPQGGPLPSSSLPPGEGGKKGSYVTTLPKLSCSKPTLREREKKSSILPYTMYFTIPPSTS